MNVIIDGIKYVPAPPVCADPAPLDFRMHVDDIGREVSLREYLHELLYTLWNEGEGFSGKRPFGNSGWEHDVYKFLVAAGAVRGELNEEGYLDSFDREGANKLMSSLIAVAFGLAV